jgi:hypothetical protein
MINSVRSGKLQMFWESGFNEETCEKQQMFIQATKYFHFFEIFDRLVRNVHGQSNWQDGKGKVRRAEELAKGYRCSDVVFRLRP